MSIAALCALKSCSACKAQLPLSAFTVARQNKDGLKRECRECSNARRKQWGAENPEKNSALKSAYHSRHAERLNAISAGWREANKDRANEHWSNWHKKNPGAKTASANAWVKRNAPYGAYRASVRRASKVQAIPKWVDPEFEQFAISEAYMLSSLRSKVTGVLHHVDHVIPLISKRVCGLHCSANLAVIPASVNQSKNNRYWPGMP